jgi:hypothetical protein
MPGQPDEEKATPERDDVRVDYATEEEIEELNSELAGTIWIPAHWPRFARPGKRRPRRQWKVGAGHRGTRRPVAQALVRALHIQGASRRSGPDSPARRPSTLFTRVPGTALRHGRAGPRGPGLQPPTSTRRGRGGHGPVWRRGRAAAATRSMCARIAARARSGSREARASTTAKWSGRWVSSTARE